MSTNPEHRSLKARLRALASDQFAVDVTLAVGLALLATAQLAAFALLGFDRHGGPGGPIRPPVPAFLAPAREPTLVMYLLVVACFLPLAFRRKYPLITLGLVTAAAAAYDLMPRVPVWTYVGVIIALYTVATRLPRRKVVVVSVVVAAIMLATGLPPFSTDRWIAEFTRIVALIGVAAALGDATRNRQAYVAEVEQRALEAERTREEEARRRVDEERLRIARELHDVTAHSLSIIAVQSGAAAHVLDKDPEEARKALGVIRHTAKSSLEELRSMLGVLRNPDEGDAPLAPAPRLASVNALVRQCQDAGLPVTLEIEGDLSDVPAVVDSSAYRIVQEALTNVVRHAGPGASATVHLRVEAGSMTVQVADNGCGTASEGAADGHGIAGMRERVAALGGTFNAGPGTGGGFVVTARMPLSANGSEARM